MRQLSIAGLVHSCLALIKRLYIPRKNGGILEEQGGWVLRAVEESFASFTMQSATNEVSRETFTKPRCRWKHGRPKCKACSTDAVDRHTCN